MSRKSQAQPREIKPDCKFGDKLIRKFINNFMWDGKLSKASGLVYSAIEQAMKQLGIESDKTSEFFQDVIENARPQLGIKPRRVGGATLQVPYEIPVRKSISMAMKWIVDVVRNKKGKASSEWLRAELVAIYNKEGASVSLKKKQDLFRMAESNRVNAAA